MSMSMMNKLISFFLVIFGLLAPVASLSQEIDSEKDAYVSDIKKGQKAPYDGILMTHRLAAEIEQKCSDEVQESRCKIQTKKEVGLCESKCKERVDGLEGGALLAAERHKKEIEAKNTRIEALESKLPKWYENPRLWFAAGVFLGGATVVLTVKTVNR